MNKILVDSCVWIDFFRGGKSSKMLKSYLLDDIVYTNEIILSEILPTLVVNKNTQQLEVFQSIHKIPFNIDWKDIRNRQIQNLKQGINGVGIPDLIIWQQVIQNKDIELYSFDKHFELMKS